MSTTPHDKCSIGLASALFNLSDNEFVRQYVKSGKIHTNRLHQLSWRRVLQLYNETPDRQKKHAIDRWRMKKDFNL